MSAPQPHTPGGPCYGPEQSGPGSTESRPFLAFALHPPLWLAGGLAFVASFGYAAALPVQERLVGHTAPDARGQVFGLAGAGLMLGQAFGAILAGIVAQYLGGGSVAAGRTMFAWPSSH